VNALQSRAVASVVRIAPSAEHLWLFCPSSRTCVKTAGWTNSRIRH